MGGPGIEPVPGVGGLDAAAVLEPAWPCPEGLAGCGLVSGAEGDDVTAGQAILSVAGGEPGRGLLGFEVGADASAGIGEGSPHDLDDAASAEVDARSEHGRYASDGRQDGARRVEAWVRQNATGPPWRTRAGLEWMANLGIARDGPRMVTSDVPVICSRRLGKRGFGGRCWKDPVR